MHKYSRARRVITRGPTGNVGKFPSMKMGRSIHWESKLERDRFRQLEFERDVISYREQPFSVSFRLGGKRRTYTPDIEVTRVNGVFIEEVKPEEKLSCPELQARLAALTEVFESQGMQFRVVTERTIRRQPYLKNVTGLLRYSRLLATEKETNLVLRVTGAGRGVPLGDLFQELERSGYRREAVLAMLWQGQLKINMEEDITDRTPVEINWEE